MDLAALITALGYLDAGRRWIPAARAEGTLAGSRMAWDRLHSYGAEGVIGTYVYQTSRDDALTPPQPAVFVAHADDEQEARLIHKRLWNTGSCPFLIVVLPGSVRVYAGFDYSPEDPKRALIANEPADALQDGVPESLRAFQARAIDSGRIWSDQARHLGSDTRVDFRLLNNLKELSRQLQLRYGLTRELSHALIGKYIYFRYLRDRRILDDEWLSVREIDPDAVFGRQATALGFEALAQALQDRFNGDIFPLPPNDGAWRVNGAIPFLAGVFHGDTPSGQLALDFAVYDFSYIPVELLSSIYEQFLKAEGKGEGDGVVYTPEVLAEYLLAELNVLHPLRLGNAVLDPCCGSGIFLVLAYRRLIGQLWQERGTRPSAKEMREVLQQSIFGVEKDGEACSITAFGLVLTLLSHLEPPELHANDGFQFPRLVGENIFHSDLFDPDCPVFREGRRFHWIIGNPPWTSADEQNSDHRMAIEWMQGLGERGQAVGERRLDEAFTWRAADLLEANGHAGLIIMATSLVNPSSAGYRRQFFSRHEVMRVTNFANLRRILFMGPEGKRAEAPAACLIYRSADPGRPKRPILHFGPFVADEIPVRSHGKRRRVWTITLYEGDIQEIAHSDAEEDLPGLWKVALWGTHQDRRTLGRLRRLLPRTLGDLIDSRGWTLENGVPYYRGRAARKEAFVPVRELRGALRLPDRPARRLSVDRAELKPLAPSEQAARRRHGLGIIAAPHLVVVPDGALFSDLDFVIPSPKVGISASRADAAILKAVALYLNSSIARYAHFFDSPSSGIYINTANKQGVRAIPIPDFSREQAARLADAYEVLKQEDGTATEAFPSQAGRATDLQAAIDTVVERTLGIPDSIGSVARDFIGVRYQLTEGKTGESASAPPAPQDLKAYGERLRLTLDDFARRHHRVTLAADREAVLATVTITEESAPIPVEVKAADGTAHAILAAVSEQHSQWAYVQRSVRVFDGPQAHIVKAARLLDWTPTQAVQDAADIVAEVLDRTTPREPATT